MPSHPTARLNTQPRQSPPVEAEKVCSPPSHVPVGPAFSQVEETTWDALKASGQRWPFERPVLVKGGVADLCIFDPSSEWTVEPAVLRSQGKHTPFSGHSLPARVRWTLVGGQIAFEAPQ